ncbi:MAG: AAA family ATPase [Provencibacterium sp.]|nr:AAA family ATPase [Provencibacterium sp.]
MKILHSGDWHIGSFPGPEREGVNLRGQDTLRCIDFMIDTARRDHPDIAVVSGDLFHQARVWSDRALSETRTAIRKIENLAEVCPVVILRGTPNHDGAEQFAVLKEHFKAVPRVRIITEPQVVEMEFSEGNLSVACLPGFDAGAFRARLPGLSREEENRRFTEELGKLALGLKAQCNPQAMSLLISHYTVPGCNMESGQTQFFAGAEPMLMPDVLATAGFDLVALGHIHRPQRVQSCRDTFYCGAVNAMNFNDEGQERGFYIHSLDAELPYDRLTESVFYPAPARGFCTVRLGENDIAAWNAGNKEEVAQANWAGIVNERIVRVLYACSDDTEKAFHRAAMEKALYESGAFWVAEIIRDQAVIAVNREQLSERTDPERNLAGWLVEKGFPPAETAKIIEAARPIISQACAQGGEARLTGVFEPLAIEVHNYRKYADEHFDFRGISLCTVNGKNGAGKSSLFMDAIVDCLYEEPREGELTGWISKDEAVRSGSISFTFRIGERIFRVVRTRAKSGKASLNLSELQDGSWVNRSAEKLRDTQTLVESIIGMDSLTLESCALIMQDKYGLFLQADKADRMSVLGNILGLGMYAGMERTAREQLAEANRQIAQRRAAIDALLEQVNPEESVTAEYHGIQLSIRQNKEKLDDLTRERREAGLALALKEHAAKQAGQLLSQLQALKCRQEGMEDLITDQENILSVADVFLSQSQDILSGVSRYNMLLEQEKELIAGKALFEAQTSSLRQATAEKAELTARIARQRQQIDSQQQEYSRIQNRLEWCDMLRQKAEQYESEKQRLAMLQERGQAFIALSEELAGLNQKAASATASFREEAARKKAELQTLQGKAALLENCGCIDPGHAQCRFLADAQAARERLDPYREECTAWRLEREKRIAEVQAQIQAITRQREELRYDAAAVREQQQLVAKLEPLAAEYREMAVLEKQAGLVSEQMQQLEQMTAEGEQQLQRLIIRIAEMEQEIGDSRVAAEQHREIVAQMECEKVWLEKEKQLPVVQQKKSAAEKRCRELRGELAEMALQSVELKEQWSEARTQSEDAIPLRQRCDDLDIRVSELQQAVSALQERAGALRQRMEDISRTRQQINGQQQELNALGSSAATLEILKAAFSQDGIPHSIVRSVLPQLTDTANSILGQMTGGRMGMRFITEKVLKSNKEKEVAALDIQITDGSDAKSYDSNSGGEKVKAALSAILALSELQSTTTGIQLGMLFIDEPPFLDDEGTQAYCDALETIKRKYPELIVMTITHDPAMKARFPQSLDVIKTDAGSKVVVA